MAKAIAVKPENEFSERTRRAIEKIHSTRFSTLKKAMNHSLAGRYQNAVEEYLNFFNIIAGYKNCNESEISPSLFRLDKDITEIFLISQVYWDLSKIYDRDPRFFGKMQKYLQKFLEFSKGFKFQYANSQLIGKYVKSGKCRNKKEFEQVYNAINKNGDYCYIATYCFGETHPITNDLRLFKKELLKRNLGKKLVRIYYQISPKLLNFCRKYPFLGVPTKVFIFYPLLFLTYSFWDKKILKGND
jgi:hypothetical protein